MVEEIAEAGERIWSGGSQIVRSCRGGTGGVRLGGDSGAGFQGLMNPLRYVSCRAIELLEQTVGIVEQVLACRIGW